jgi:hypothetical protein
MKIYRYLSRKIKNISNLARVYSKTYDLLHGLKWTIDHNLQFKLDTYGYLNNSKPSDATN